MRTLMGKVSLVKTLINAEWPPSRTILDAVFTKAIFLKGDIAFFHSTNKSIYLHHSLENLIILQKCVSAIKRLRIFCIRGNCRAPPLVLRFLKFGNEGGQAYGKDIQNPGL